MSETKVIGEVREYHFRCDEGHEYSVMAKYHKDEDEVKEMIRCLINGCFDWAYLLSSNSAEISKNPADLLQN